MLVKDRRRAITAIAGQVPSLGLAGAASERFCSAPPAPGYLDRLHKICGVAPKSGRDLQQRMQSGLALTTLDTSKVRAFQIGGVGQLLLRDSSGFSG